MEPELFGHSETGRFVMDSKNQKGQVLVEVTIVGFLLVLVFFGALSQLDGIKTKHYRSQFSEEKSHEKNRSKK